MTKEYLPREKAFNAFSRNLRNNMTKQEKRLWYDFLKKYSLRFYRQRIIGNYVVDFYCDKAKLVLELDGSQHYEAEAMEYDLLRTKYLESLGLKIMRFANSDIDNHFEGVCKLIEQSILSQASPDSSFRKEP